MDTYFLKKMSKITAKILAIIICIILGLIILINISLWFHRTFNKDSYGKIFGVYPLIVESNSMYPIFKKGDLIFSKPIKAEEISKNDIISFENINSPKKQIVTHRIKSIYYDGKIKKFITRGDANNFDDEFKLSGNYILGKYVGKIPKLGAFIDLIRQPLTLILIFTVVILAYVLGYLIMKMKKQKNQNSIKSN